MELRDTESSHNLLLPEDDSEDNMWTQEENILDSLLSEEGVTPFPDDKTPRSMTDNSSLRTSKSPWKRKSLIKYVYNVKKSKQTKLETEMSEYF